MFGLYSRIAAAIVLAVFLAGVYWKGHTSGAKSVQTAWDADVAARTAQALEASEAARKVEQELTAKVGKVDRAYQDQKRATATVAAAAADGLRNLEAILTAPNSPASATVASAGNHGAGSAERELLGSCAASLVGMGKEADRMALKVLTLQEYIKAIQPKP